MSAGAPRKARHAPPARVIDAIGVGACVALLGAGYLVGLGPRLRERAQGAEWREQLELGKKELARLSEERRGLLAREVTAGQKLKACAVQMQGVRELNRRVPALVNVAGECGLEIAEVGPGTPAPQDRFTVVPIKVRGTGTYAGVSAFLGRLRASFPDTAVVALQVSTEVPGETTPEFSVELAWYALPDGAARAPAPVPPK